MQQLLIACALLLCMLVIYLHVAGGEQGLSQQQKKAHDAATKYVRGIDS